jgi:hypothetical protein
MSLFIKKFLIGTSTKADSTERVGTKRNQRDFYWDWEERIFIGIYSTQWDKTIETSHVFFKEPPSGSENSSVDQLLINTVPKNPSDYNYLIGFLHHDPEDNVTYVTTRIY